MLLMMANTTCAKIPPLPFVALISVCYNDQTRLSRFLEALRKVEYPNFFFVLVDNNSRDESVQMVRVGLTDAEIITLGENRGTTGGYNVGFQRALARGAKYVMTLAIDVDLHPDCLFNLIEVCESNHKIGAVSPLLFYSDEPNKVQMYGGSRDVRTGMGEHDYNGANDLTALPPIRDAQYLDGGTMLMRADVLRRVGGFDEKLFMYLEDGDLSLRLQQAGNRTVAVRDAWAWHYHRENKGPFPPPYEVFYTTRNRFYFVQKHAGQKAWWILVGRTLLGLPRPLFYFLRRGKMILAYAYVAGVLYGIAGWMGKRGWVK
jgi:GT2 family glycosyltransferase